MTGNHKMNQPWLTSSRRLVTAWINNNQVNAEENRQSAEWKGTDDPHHLVLLYFDGRERIGRGWANLMTFTNRKGSLLHWSVWAQWGFSPSFFQLEAEEKVRSFEPPEEFDGPLLVWRRMWEGLLGVSGTNEWPLAESQPVYRILRATVAGSSTLPTI